LKKNFFEVGRTGYQKKRNFALISKMCRRIWQKGKNFLLKNGIYRDLENFAKNRFSKKKFLGTS
jgi:hypothetical protein